MKKLFFLLACIAMSVLSYGQDNQLVWANGRLLYGTPVAGMDSLTYAEMEDVDTLHLLLPSTLVKVVHDTVLVNDTVVVHDTVYVEVNGGGNMENNHEYIDLGLSVKWATCNVGATKPEEYGDYFAWGETETKESYNWSTYKWCNGSSNTQTKYCTSSSYGTVDNKTGLEAADDAATANWGSAWRMPTKEEQDELRTKCTWTWTTENGVNGYKVTSKSNGNSIFLPAAGYRSGIRLYGAGSSGSYWSSSLNTGNPNNAYHLDFGKSSVDWLYRNRDHGQSVRPVCQ